jgi:hypothetical protein
MSFSNLKDFQSTFSAAERYAAENGRLATMTDIIMARSLNDINSIFWHRYYTTLSSEFYGLYKGEKPMIVVAHGVGPLSTLEGIEKAYDICPELEKTSTDYGQITQAEFDKLVEGEYGEVKIVDVDEMLTYYNSILKLAYQNGNESLPGLWDNGYFTTRALVSDPLFLARVGNENLALMYLKSYEAIAREAMKKRSALHGRQVDDETPVYAGKIDWTYKAPYTTSDLKTWYIRSPQIERLKGKGFAYASLLSVSQLEWTGLRDTRIDQLTFEMDTHEWWHGYRLLAIRDAGFWSNTKEFDFDAIESKTPKSAYVASSAGALPEFFSIIESDGRFFTEAVKEGCSMDSGKAVFAVSSANPIGDQVHITLKDENMFFLRYDLSEVRVVKPDGANAFKRVASDPRGQWIIVQFYAVEANLHERLIAKDELTDDLDRFMTIVEELEAE